MAAASETVIDQLREKGSAENVGGMARYAIESEGRLGTSMPDIRKIAKAAGKDHALALELWESGIAEARIAACLIDMPEEVTEEQMDDWVTGFNSWDVTDQVCLNLFDKTQFAEQKIHEWSLREEEFVKRAAYALIAGVAWHDKQAPDNRFIEYLPVIKMGATDERNFVKKAVSWALRHIGKRNLKLNKAAIKTAREIQQIDSKAARWIASDVNRELESEKIQARLAK